jgi:hypothetical protein
MIADPFDALADYLRHDAGVTALAGQRVWPRELPADEAANMPRAAIVLVPQGGLWGHDTVSLQAPRCDVTCYAETPKAAYALYGAAFEALRALARKTHAGALLNSAVQGGGPIQGRDPDTRWPFVWSSWIISASTILVE